MFHNEKQFNEGTVIDYKTVFNKGVSMIISASVSSVHTCDTCSGWRVLSRISVVHQQKMNTNYLQFGHMDSEK